MTRQFMRKTHNETAYESLICGGPDGLYAAYNEIIAVGTAPLRNIA